MKPFAILMLLALAACGEPASTYDPDQGRFRSTSEMKQEIKDRLRDLERERDCWRSAGSNTARADCLMQETPR